MRKAHLQDVTDRLKQDYGYHLSDTYENPEYLKWVSQELFDSTYSTMLSSLEQKLDEFAYRKQVKKFLQVLENH